VQSGDDAAVLLGKILTTQSTTTDGHTEVDAGRQLCSMSSESEDDVTMGWLIGVGAPVVVLAGFEVVIK
jgi:hypothetical protein